MSSSYKSLKELVLLADPSFHLEIRTTGPPEYQDRGKLTKHYNPLTLKCINIQCPVPYYSPRTFQSPATTSKIILCSVLREIIKRPRKVLEAFWSKKKKKNWKVFSPWLYEVHTSTKKGVLLCNCNGPRQAEGTWGGDGKHHSCKIPTKKLENAEQAGCTYQLDWSMFF